MSARETLHSALLTTPTAATLPHPEGWASIRIQRYRDEVRAETLAEAKAEVIAWLVKKAREGTPIEQLASKVDRGAVRIFLGTGHFQDAMDAHHDEVLRKAVAFLEEIGTPITGDRTEHERGVMYAARRLVEQLAAGPEEKASATAPTATPVPDGEIKFVGFPSIALSGWNVVQLAPDYHGHVFMQIDGWLPEGRPAHLRPAGTAQMTYAHLHGHAIPRDITVRVETKGYGAPQKFMKIQWRNYDGAEPPAPQPESELTVRQQRLLEQIRLRPRELRSSGPVAALYRTWGVRTAQHEARRDLARLADLGYLTRAGDDTGRRYDLNTRKDGQR